MIIGVTGTIGAGKGTVVEYLTEKEGFAHYSVRDFLTREIRSRGLPLDRDSMREVANAIRAEHQPSYIIETLYARALEAEQDALVESIRAIGEAQFLRSRSAKLLAVDADRRLRFERVTARGSHTDDVDFETFVEHEEKELASTDPAGQNIIGVMQMADYRIENDGSLHELHSRIQEALQALRA